ncbi:sensor histidine kinase [Taibaiella chishuiensis]|uniref:histidine kinase n=1 Tax=Taibaiella chishuiensis TaxID=1434707 RepID=A0A2P8D7P9_9BACT|nr:HAMP domain-containing sensor histidine kinase [Taibaiella chishuiensis]PSK93219.1 signal transduction histidine kinase [Taibaiella chishuiensis]
MSKLQNRSLKRFVQYAALVLGCSIPVYYFILSQLWQYELNEHNIVLTAKAVREDSFLIIGAVTGLTVLFFGLLLAGLVLLNRRLGRKLWTPFYDSLSRIRTFDLQQHKQIRFADTDIDEFAELNTNLDKLIGSAISAYTQQKEFADNASHELQTPLAIVQSKLDLLLQSRPLTQEQYDLIEDAHKALTRVGRINKNLLLLARIDNNRYGEATSIALTTLLQTTLEDFEPFLKERQMAVGAKLDEPVTVQGNRELVTILVHNLLSNAIRHSAAGAAIFVQLSPGLLEFRNAGRVPLHTGRLFQRFGTVSSETPGTGLGLALVKQVADRYGWTVAYHFENGQHIFSLRF